MVEQFERSVVSDPPALEPVDLAYMQSHLGYDLADAQDDVITLQIQASRNHWESYTRQSFISQEITEHLDSFWTGYLSLERWPVIGMVSVIYTKEDDTTEDITNRFELSNWSDPAYLCLKNGQTLPTDVKKTLGAIEVKYTVGYGASATDVKPVIRLCIANWAGLLFADRMDNEMKPGIESLCYKMMALEKR